MGRRLPCPPCALPRHARREDGSDPPPCARSPLGLGAAGKPPKPGKKPFPGSHHLQASGWDISQSLLPSHCFPMAKAHPALPCHTNPATASRSLLPHPASALPPAPQTTLWGCLLPVKLCQSRGRRCKAGASVLMGSWQCLHPPAIGAKQLLQRLLQPMLGFAWLRNAGERGHHQERGEMLAGRCAAGGH